MDVIKICGISVVFTAFLVLIRAIKGEIAMPISICISVLIMGEALSLVLPLISFLKELEALGGEEYLTVMLKSLGIAIVTSLTSEICRDSGEASVASRVELFGKCEIIILALPILKSLIKLMSEVLST